MARYHKIVWSEGMFLGPHHFQQMDRYHEGLLNFRLRSTMPIHWGLSDLEVDPEALDNNIFALLSCHGILPNGSCIDIPQTDPAPEGRAVGEHFDTTFETFDVYLGVPSERPGLPNCILEDGGISNETRYSRKYVKVVDENTGDNEQEIPTAKRNFRILFQNESLDGYDHIKIAELERSRDGTLSLRDEYIPPSITVSASMELTRIIRRLTELLTARSDDLRARSRERGDGSYEFGSGDVSNLWILNTLNSFIPELSHFRDTGRVHPEDLFRILARFAGALTVFSVRIRPINLPRYDHQNLSRSFGELDRVIRELLELLTPSAAKCVFIPLVEIPELSQEGGITYRATIEDYLLGPEYSFHIAVRGQTTQEELIFDMENRAKIASTDQMTFLLGRSVRGISLSFLRTPPEDIPIKAGYLYFALDPESDFWNDVEVKNQMAIFIPPTSKEAQVELMALEEKS